MFLVFVCGAAGFVQFIDSVPVAEVLASDGTIQNFFRKHHPLENAPYGIQPEIIDNYVRSCGKIFWTKFNTDIRVNVFIMPMFIKCYFPNFQLAIVLLLTFLVLEIDTLTTFCLHMMGSYSTSTLDLFWDVILNLSLHQ